MGSMMDQFEKAKNTLPEQGKWGEDWAELEARLSENDARMKELLEVLQTKLDVFNE